jgi:hypothetical protein
MAHPVGSPDGKRTEKVRMDAFSAITAAHWKAYRKEPQQVN